MKGENVGLHTKVMARSIRSQHGSVGMPKNMSGENLDSMARRVVDEGVLSGKVILLFFKGEEGNGKRSIQVSGTIDDAIGVARSELMSGAIPII